MADNLPEPESREEQFLAKAAGEDVTLPTPESRKELFLNAIAQGGGGGGGGSAIEYIELTITGASGSDVNVTASEYLDDIVTKIDGGMECVFKLTVPSNSGLPLSGTFLFRVSNYFPDGANIWCFSPFYDNLSDVMYMLKLEFVPVNGNYHTQIAVVHIFMP